LKKTLGWDLKGVGVLNGYAPFIYSALCMATGMTPEEALFEGFAIREVNAIAENCVPFLDSLEFGE
jgi:hypothetical protein